MSRTSARPTAGAETHVAEPKSDAIACPGPVNRRALPEDRVPRARERSPAEREPTWPGSLAAEAASPGADREFSVILLWAAGGPSHLETFDLKPDAPAEYRGPFQPIAHQRAGHRDQPSCCRTWRSGPTSSRSSAACSTTATSTPAGTGRMLSGYASVAANPFQSEFPEIGSVVAKHLEGQVARPAAVRRQQRRSTAAAPAYLGPAYVPFIYSGDPEQPDVQRRQPVADPGGRRAAAQAQRSCCRAFDTLRREIDRTQTMSALDQFNRRALEMLTSPRTRQAFDLSPKTRKLRDRYGRTTGGQSLLLARRLVEAGVRFVQISRPLPGQPRTSASLGPTNWDDHSVNSDIFKAYERADARRSTSAVSALIDDLYARGSTGTSCSSSAASSAARPKIGHQDKSKRPGPRPLVPGDERLPRRRRPEDGPGHRRHQLARRRPRRAGDEQQLPAGHDLSTASASTPPRPTTTTPAGPSPS